MKRIGVIGSINMDLTAKLDRLPVRGETLTANEMHYVPGGKGANQAVAAARLGGDVTMFGCVGDDGFADNLIDNLKDNGIDTSYIRRDKAKPSGIAMITVAENDNSIVVVPGANHSVTVGYVEEVKEAVLSMDIIVLQNEIPLETVIYVVDLCHSNGKTVIYNPAPAVKIFDGMMEKIDYITPNEHEAAIIFPEFSSLDDIVKHCKGKMIITLGGDGVAGFDGGRLIKVPARPVNVIDTTGAGDTFNGAFAYALSDGKSFIEALNIANIAAALSTEKYGAQGGMPTLKEVMA